jgi:septal ring factor EnvC (AmiA/AmiB activator)
MNDEPHMPGTPGNGREFSRGRESGRQDQQLDDHAQHLAKINGSIERFSTSLDGLQAEVSQLREDLRTRDTRETAAKETLAAETQRRKEALEVTAADIKGVADAKDRTFTRREKLMGMAFTAIGTGSLLYGFLHH